MATNGIKFVSPIKFEVTHPSFEITQTCESETETGRALVLTRQ